MFRSILLAILALGLSAIPGPAAPRLKDPSPGYFPTTVGARWVYDWDGKEVVEVVTAVSENSGVTVVSVGEERSGDKVFPLYKVAVRTDGLYLTEELTQTYDPPIRLLKFPIRDGEKWETETSRADLGRVYDKRQAVRTEQIETQAGRFGAVRVEMTMETTAPATKSTQTRWYAPGVGLVKVSESRVLKSFTPAEPVKK